MSCEDQFLLSDKDPAVKRYYEWLEESVKDANEGKTAWKSMHMQVAEKRVLTLLGQGESISSGARMISQSGFRKLGCLFACQLLLLSIGSIGFHSFSP